MREPLEIQTIQPKKYLKLTNELGYNGNMLPILEMDRMSKFAYARMQFCMRIPTHEARRMRINKRMPVQEDPWMQIHMQIPVSRYPPMQM